MRNSLINRGILFKHIQKGFPIKGCVESVEDHGLVYVVCVYCMCVCVCSIYIYICV